MPSSEPVLSLTSVASAMPLEEEEEEESRWTP